MLEIFEIWICQIFEFLWPPKATIALKKRPVERDGDGNNNKVYLNINVNLYYLVYVRIR